MGCFAARTGLARLAGQQRSPFQRQFELFHGPVVPLSPPSSSPTIPAGKEPSFPLDPHVWDFEREFLSASRGALDRTDRDGAFEPRADTDSFGSQLLRGLTNASLRFVRSLEIAGKAAHGAVARPTEDDHVATLSEFASGAALERLHRQMWQHPDGRRVLEKKPLLDDRFIDYAALRKLPTNTLGRAYMQFIDENKLHAGARQPVRFVDDPELAFVLTRYRQLHDFMHTLYGVGISMEAEVALKLVEFRQTGLPMTLLAAIFGPLATPVMRLHVPAVATDGRVVGEALAGKMRRITTGEEASSFSQPNAPVHVLVDETRAQYSGRGRAGEEPVDAKAREAGARDRGQVLYPRHVLLTELLPWAWKAANAVKIPLHLIYVEEWLDRPLEDLRRHCGILPPPAHLAAHFASKA